MTSSESAARILRIVILTCAFYGSQFSTTQTMPKYHRHHKTSQDITAGCGNDRAHLHWFMAIWANWEMTNNSDFRNWNVLKVLKVFVSVWKYIIVWPRLMLNLVELSSWNFYSNNITICNDCNVHIQNCGYSPGAVCSLLVAEELRGWRYLEISVCGKLASPISGWEITHIQSYSSLALYI